METASQKRRTYEIIGKYIAKSEQVHLEFAKDRCDANLVTKTITLPANLKAPNMYTGLAYLMHEAAHIGHSRFDLPLLTGNDPTDHSILNFVEDGRIDHKNFGRLPMIRNFYEEMYDFLEKDGKLVSKSKDSTMETKIMADAMFYSNGFHKFASGNKTIENFLTSTGMYAHIQSLQNVLEDIEQRTKARQNTTAQYKQGQLGIKTIRDLISNLKKQNPQLFQGQGGQAGQQGKGAGKGSGGGAGGGGLDIDPNGLTSGVPGALLADCDPNVSGMVPPIPPAALQERTKQGFNELLCEKERKLIDDGTILDPENLTAFFTGSIEDLFIQDEHIKVKRSKILLLLDGSGSMSSPLLDKMKRSEVLAKTAQAVTDILDETIQLEGLDIDYGVRMFDGNYHVIPLNAGWQQVYIQKAAQGGGTDLINAFSKAQDEIMADALVTGRRLIICLTDGEVSHDEIKEMKRRITAHNADVRAMVIGTGAEPHSTFIQTITGHNILAHEASDIVLMEAIMEALE